jgi:hypothetical protein
MIFIHRQCRSGGAVSISSFHVTGKGLHLFVLAGAMLSILVALWIRVL